MTILAVGAAGTLAGEIVPALVRRGAIVRGLVHRPEQMQLANNTKYKKNGRIIY